MRLPYPARLPTWGVQPLAQLGGLLAAGATLSLLLALDAIGAAAAIAATIVALAIMVGLSPLVAVGILICWIAVQNLAAPLVLALGRLGVDDIRGLIGTKELIAVSLVAVSIIPAAVTGRVKLASCDKLWLAYTAWILLYAVNPLVLHAEPFYLAVSARALLVPVLFYSLGRLVALEEPEGALSGLAKTVLGVSLAAAVFGMVEVFILGADFWRGLEIERYWVEVKGFSPRTIVDGLPANFYGQYGLVSELGRGIRRLASTYGDPLAAGYSLFFAALLCFAALRYGESRFRASYALGFAALTAALALTVSRVALGALVIGCALILVRERTLLGARGWAALTLVLLGLLVFFRHALAPAFVSAITLEDPSTRSHLLDLARGVQTLASPRTLLGFGLGTAGAPAAASAVHIGITESAYLVLLAQVGIAGVVLFLGAMIATYRFVARRAEASAAAPFPLHAANAGLVGYALSGVVSEQIFTTTSLAPFWILLGSAVSWCAAQSADGARSAG